MTTDTERIAALESKFEAQGAWLKSIDGKVDELRAALNMGKGALFVVLKVGAALVAFATFIAWITDHLKVAIR